MELRHRRVSYMRLTSVITNLRNETEIPMSLKYLNHRLLFFSRIIFQEHNWQRYNRRWNKASASLGEHMKKFSTLFAYHYSLLILYLFPKRPLSESTLYTYHLLLKQTPKSVSVQTKGKLKKRKSFLKTNSSYLYIKQE